LHPISENAPGVPVITSITASYALPAVPAVIVPPELGVNFHQTDFPVGLWLEAAMQLGEGSVASDVAAELSIVLAKEAAFTIAAFAKLSFGGGPALFTVKIRPGDAAPPPGGGFATPTMNSPPNCSSV
jgi:hypothetical protein